MKGTVKFYNEEKGYGFITPEGNAKDIFVHASGLSGSISQNDEVEYTVSEGKKGPTAVDVKRRR